MTLKSNFRFVLFISLLVIHFAHCAVEPPKLPEGFTWQVVLFIPIVALFLACLIFVPFLFIKSKYLIGALIAILFIIIELVLLGIFIWFQISIEYKDEGPFFIVNLVILLVWILFTGICVGLNFYFWKRNPNYHFFEKKQRRKRTNPNDMGMPVPNAHSLDAVHADMERAGFHYEPDKPKKKKKGKR